jgi:hypothetical protein
MLLVNKFELSEVFIYNLNGYFTCITVTRGLDLCYQLADSLSRLRRSSLATAHNRQKEWMFCYPSARVFEVAREWEEVQVEWSKYAAIRPR